MPCPFAMAKRPILIGTFPGTSMKDYLIFGAGGDRKGRVTGVEVLQGGKWNQLWRMDYHTAHAPSDKDFDDWKSKNNPQFSYHVPRF